ncbi:MAG: PAS domain S-box protein [Oscillochloris sp.]|nr:PAS domain S-box protein [Oscillochloris sp.]
MSLCVASDVTAENRIAVLEARIAELEQSEAHLRTLVEASQLFVITTPDPDQLIQSIANTGAVTISDLMLQFDNHRLINILAVDNNITALKYAQRALHDRDEQLRMAYDAAQMGTWRCDFSSSPGTIQLDPRAQIHYGVDADDVPLAMILDRIHPEDRALWRRSLVAMIDPTGKGRYLTEYRVIHRDGSVHWLAIHTRTYFAGEGAERRVVLSSGTSQEITERKLEDAALRASEANLRALFASTSQAYLLLDQNLCVVQWNVVAEVSIAQRFGCVLRKGMLISESAGHIAQLRAALDGESIQFEVDVSTLDVPCWLAMEYTPVRESDGQIRGVCISALNVTDRHLAEIELRASETRFRLLAEQARDLIYRYRVFPEPGFEYVSPSATVITGYTPEEHYADPLLGQKLIYHNDQLLLSQFAEDSTMNGSLILRWQRKDGSVIWTEQVNRMICDDSGRLVAVEGIARDITERKQAEDDLRASAEQLQSLSRRLVEAHERERRHIARELHDEIGQVLTGLKLSLGAAAATAPPDLAAILADARASISELMGRVRGISLDLRPALLDDLGLLPALGWYLDRYTPRTGVQVEIRHQGVGRRFSAEVKTVAYRTIQEALTNVARHAQTQVAIVRLLADQQRLMLRIDDDGCGFDCECALAAQTTGGLSGMQERVQLIGGVLTIESAPGEGTHIIVELPLSATEAFL